MCGRPAHSGCWTLPSQGDQLRESCPCAIAFGGAPCERAPLSKDRNTHSKTLRAYPGKWNDSIEIPRKTKDVFDFFQIFPTKSFTAYACLRTGLTPWMSAPTVSRGPPGAMLSPSTVSSLTFCASIEVPRHLRHGFTWDGPGGQGPGVRSGPFSVGLSGMRTFHASDNAYCSAAHPKSGPSRAHDRPRRDTSQTRIVPSSLADASNRELLLNTT